MRAEPFLTRTLVASRLHRFRAVVTEAVHRLVEQHAATRGDLLAVAEREGAVTYRELNYAANATARRLIACGFRRGGHATVRMRRGIDLAVTLLAILKTGGSYTWIDPGSDCASWPDGVSIASGSHAGDDCYLRVDLPAGVAAPIAYSPNLPVVVRGGDAACVLQNGHGGAPLVPHATITSLRARAVPHPTPWTGDAGAFDLWMALMAGTTAVVEQAAAVAAA